VTGDVPVRRGLAVPCFADPGWQEIIAARLKAADPGRLTPAG